MDDAAIVAAFLKRFHEDCRTGGSRELEAYQSLYPGYETAIAAEYEDLKKRQADSADRSAVEPESARSDRVVGHYRILRELARGGQGEVYLANDERLHRFVALKVLRGLGSLSQGLLARFRREAEIASRLDHPAICTVYESGFDDGLAFIAMRFVEGRSLAQTIAGTRASMALASTDADQRKNASRSRAEILEAARLVEKTARALHAAHEAGVIHRDVKPGNIMITPEGEPVILDFGLAAVVTGEEPSLTRTGDVFGSPAYMSPEQLARRSMRLDRRTDVYSLGVTLYELLTLSRPFEAPTFEALYHAILTREAPAPRAFSPAICKDLEVVLETALSKDRDRRYQTALDFAEDLRRIRELLPIRARPLSPLGRAMRWSRRRPAAAALLAVLALSIPTVSALGGFILANLPALEEQRQRASRERVESLLEEGYGELGHGSAKRSVASFETALELDPGNAEAVGGLLLAYQHKRDPLVLHDLLERHRAVVERTPYLGWFRTDALLLEGRTAEAEALEKRLPEPRTHQELFLAAERLSHRDHAVGESGMDEARELYARTVMAAPTRRALYFFGLAHALGHSNAPKQSREIHDLLVQLWPGSEKAQMWAGFAVRHTDVDLAIETYRRSLAIARLPLAHMNLADALNAKDLVSEAVAQFRLALELSPDEWKVRLNLGALYMRRGRPQDAIAVYEEALARGADEPFLHANYARALRAVGRLDEAIDHGNRALAQRPDLHDVRLDLGAAYADRKKWRESAEVLRTFLHEKPGDGVGLNGLGVALRETGDLEGSLDALQRAAAKLPEQALVQSNLAGTLHAMGKRERALAAYEHAARLAKQDAEPRIQIANLLMEAKRFGEALRVLEEAVRLKPDHPHGYCLLGAALLQTGNPHAAMDALRNALEHCPEKFGPLSSLAQAYRSCERLDEAADMVRRAVEMKADHGLGWVLLAGILHDQNRLEVAVEAYRQATYYLQNDPGLWNDYGVALRDAGHAAEAVPAYETSIALAPGQANPWFNLGDALRDQGELESAIEKYERAVELDEKYGKAWQNLGRALREAGRLDEALRAGGKAVDLLPQHPPAWHELAITLLKSGDPARAADVARQGLESNASDPQLLTFLGAALRVGGNPREAISVLQQSNAEAAGVRLTLQELGSAYSALGKYEEAEGPLREVLQLNRQDAAAHTNLALVLQKLGRFREAAEFMQSGHRLGSVQPGWSYPSGEWAENAKRLALLEEHLERVLEGESECSDPRELTELAQMAEVKSLHAGAAVLLERALSTDAGTAVDISALRVMAARAAALAAQGQGVDAVALEDPAREGWRRKSLGWLSAYVESAPSGEDRRRAVLEALLAEPALAPFRHGASFDSLPEAERVAWRSFWDEVQSRVNVTRE